MDGQGWQGSEAGQHHTTLMRLLAFIFVYAGLADDTRSAAVDTGRADRAMQASREAWTLSRRIFRRLLLLIRPVEAATRRLIVVLASGLPIPAAPATGPGRPATVAKPSDPAHDTGDAPRQPLGRGEHATCGGPATPPGAGNTPQAHARPPLFALADREKRYEWFFSGKPHGAGWKGLPLTLPGDDELDAAGILRRIAALAKALDDLPGEANRLARWRLRRMQARAAGRRIALSPLRPGPPPGSLPLSAPSKTYREEHHLLSETHTLARAALTRLDTS
jgi:hypothetical protein